MRCFRTRRKKGDPHLDPTDPLRSRANKQLGHGTYGNDRPPIAGTVGRETSQVRLRVVRHTDEKTLRRQVHQFAQPGAHVCTEEWCGYDHILRRHAAVCHSQHKCACDDDGNGIREVHTNTVEGMWTSARNILRPFRGIHKCYLSGYVAMCEFSINLKAILLTFVSALVTSHSCLT